MTIEIPAIAKSYVQSINNHDAAAFLALFADDAVVNDVGSEFRDRAAIKSWSEREIFDAHVVLEVLDAADRNGETILTTKVDGNFDRTGLPDPVIIDHQIRSKGAKIVQLTCRLSGERPRP
jgi:hypothetical protein